MSRSEGSIEPAGASPVRAESDEARSEQTQSDEAKSDKAAGREKLLEALAAILFLTQIVHLIWMSTYVIPNQLWGYGLWSPPRAPLAMADYVELPAIFTTSLLYIRRRNWKLLFLVNVQIFHIFWITDSIILNHHTLNPVLAWIAIGIDYLEVPVIIDTTRRVLRRTFQPSLKTS